MLNITLKQLEVFVAVAEYNSFTMAAEKLFMTQSTVSVHVASLENILSTPLFERVNKKRISLTPTGRTVYGYAKEVLRNCIEIEQFSSQKEPDKLRIGASSVPAQCILPNVMAEFIEKCGNCAFVLRKGDSLQIHEMLKRRTVRIGFVGTAIDRINMDYKPVMSDSIVMVTPNNTHFQNMLHSNASADDLLTEPLILREADSGTRREFERYLNDNGIPSDELNVVAEIDNPVSILESVYREVGISPVSELTVKDDLENGRLLAFSFKEKLQRNIYMVTEKDTELSVPEKNFINFIQMKINRGL